MLLNSQDAIPVHVLTSDRFWGGIHTVRVMARVTLY